MPQRSPTARKRGERRLEVRAHRGQVAVVLGELRARSAAPPRAPTASGCSSASTHPLGGGVAVADQPGQDRAEEHDRRPVGGVDAPPARRARRPAPPPRRRRRGPAPRPLRRRSARSCARPDRRRRRPAARCGSSPARRPRCRRAPEPHERHARCTRAPGVAGVGEVAQRREDVLALGGQEREARRAARPPRRCGVGLLDDREEVVRVRRADRGELARLGQALDPVLADRLEHPVARGRRVDDLQQRAVDQRGEEVEDLARASRRGRPRRSAASRPPGKTASRSASARSALGQQVPAPVDDGAQRAVARQRGAAAAGEQPEAIVEAPGDLLGRQRAQAGGGELDRQRQAVQPAADLDDRGDVLRVDGEAGRRRRAAVGEQLDRRMGERLVDAGVRAGPGQRRDLDQPLADDAQRLAAGRQDAQRAGSAPSSSSASGGDVADQVLAVVEDDERGRGRRARRGRGAARRRTACPARRRARAARPRAGRARRARGRRSRSASATGASSTSQTPSGASGRRRAPASPASRVLPGPAGAERA